MSEFSVRSDSVDVEQIMRQIRGRIREKRGVDYTEAEIEKLASVKLEKFLDPRGIRSDLVQQFRARLASDQSQDEFTEAMLYETHRPALKKLRRMLNPILKLFINPAAVSGAIQSQSRRQSDVLFYEVVHNLVVEVTRLGIEVHNLKMRVESMSSRLDFDERRARAFEGSVSRPQRLDRRPAASAGATGPAGSTGSQPDGQVSYGSVQRPPEAAAPVAAGGRDQNQGGQARPEGGGPNGGNRDGGRRRRRRRRRRPGDSQGSAGLTGSTGSTGSAGSTSSEGSEGSERSSHEPDGDGGDDQ